MYLNQFSVRIPEGREIEGGYVKMRHGQEYTLVMSNKRSEQCNAYVYIDGQHVGTWRVRPRATIRVERPVGLEKKFTFYKLGSVESDWSGLENDDSLGLIQVRFVPERPRYRAAAVTSAAVSVRRRQSDHEVLYRGIGKGALSPGGTGLSGHSDQKFHEAEDIVEDYARSTQISLRLVCDDSLERPVPLACANPVPPRIG